MLLYLGQLYNAQKNFREKNYFLPGKKKTFPCEKKHCPNFHKYRGSAPMTPLTYSAKNILNSVLIYTKFSSIVRDNTFISWRSFYENYVNPHCFIYPYWIRSIIFNL